MIKIPLKTYLADKHKYDDFEDRYKFIRSKINPLLMFNISTLPDEMYEYDGEELFIPKHINGKVAIEFYIKHYSSQDKNILLIDNFIVEIDDSMKKIPDNNKLPRGTYINMDDYIISDKQHFFNRLVLTFYKKLDSKGIILTTDIKKAKDIFKDLSRTDGKWVNFPRIHQLFDITGVNQIMFEKFIKNGGK